MIIILNKLLNWNKIINSFVHLMQFKQFLVSVNESFRLNKNFSIFDHTTRIKEIISLHDCDPRSRFLLFVRDVKNDKGGRETRERIKRLAFWLTTIRHARIIGKWRVSRSFKDILSLDSLVVSASLRAPLSFYVDPRFFEDSQRTVRWAEIFIGNLLRGPCVHREPSCNSLPRPYTRGISLEFSWITFERTSKFCYC